MKKTILYTFAALGFCSVLAGSCIAEDLGVGNIKQEENANSDWNKTRSVEVHFLSALNDANIGETDAIVNHINALGEDCSIGVIDRVDVSGGSNMATHISFATSRFPGYALNKVVKNGNGIATEGSLILYNHKNNAEEGFKVSNDCFIKFISIMCKSMVKENQKDILVPFATARFSSKEQINAAKSALGTVVDSRHNGVLIGTVKSNLVEDLKRVAESISNVKFSQADIAAGEYAIFMVADKSWVLRETTTNSVSGNVKDYCLAIEPGVE